MVKPNPPAVVVWVGAAGAAGAAVNPNPVVAVVWAVETAPSPKPPGTGCAGTAPKLKPEGATVWAVVPEGSEKPAVVAVQAEVAGAVALVACMLPKEKPAAGGAVALPKPPKLPLFILQRKYKFTLKHTSVHSTGIDTLAHHVCDKLNDCDLPKHGLYPPHPLPVHMTV